MNLKELKKELLTQDNMGTSHPYWVIRDYRKIPTERGYSDKYNYFSDEEEYTEDEIKKLLEEGGYEFTEDNFEELAEEYYDVHKYYYIEVPVDHEVFLTHKGAEEYFNSRKYAFSEKAHLYCKSAYYSNEIKFIQKFIKEWEE